MLQTLRMSVVMAVRVGIELGRQQQPTIANGRLYIRGARSVVCYQIAK